MKWAKTNTTQGFTIVELLIVVVVIAILAAITIVSYTGIQNRTHDAAVTGDLTNARKKIELYAVEKGQLPLTTAETMLATTGFKAAKGSYMTSGTTDHNFIYCMYYTGSPAVMLDYTIVAYSKSGKKFKITKDGTLSEYTTTWADQTVACQNSMTNYSANYRGYAAEDTTTGPWRTWVGGN